MFRERDIVHENGEFWVLKSTKEKCYYVMVPDKKNYGVTCISDSAYSLDSDGLSIAIARCDYMAKRAKEKAGK